MVATAHSIHKVRFIICMVLSLASSSRQLIVSSYIFAPKLRARSAATTTFANGARHHSFCWHHHNQRGAALFASHNPSFRSRTPAPIKSRCHSQLSFLRNRVMSPPNSGCSMSSLPMSSAVEEETQNNNNDKASSSMMVAKTVSATSSSLTQCGERLRSGKLVSFPTETVYGLGCHALDPIAVQKVFDAKERPLSDPLIVHVTRNEDALELWRASSSMPLDNETLQNKEIQQQQQMEKQALSALTKSFFPGPLTLVARAHPSIPQILMANTGYVACRSPSHPVARALIDAAEVPIAAPSANKFGHVSPTLAAHVMDDLGMEDVWIVDPTLGTMDDHGDDEMVAQDAATVCQVGVESTVAKIEMNANKNKMGSITILRHGAISSQSIREALEEANLSQYFSVSDSVKFTSEKTHNVAPGQTVKHYSPNVPCFMIGSSRQVGQSSTEGELDMNEEEHSILSQSVIIDYGARLVQYRPYALAYRDLSPEGNAMKAASSVFETLRWSETVEGAIRVFVPELVFEEKEGQDDDGVGGGALVLAVKDKLTRAASAVVVNIFQ